MNYDCTPDLLDLLRNLRTAQKKFFASKAGSFEKATALQESKRLEKELDLFLEAKSTPPTPTLFT